MDATVVARAPNHLGDGVMALPALAALARRVRLVIQAPRWGPDLYRDLPAEIRERGPIEDADVAVLFAPSFRAAWHARRARRRVGTPADGRRWLLTDVVPEGVHQRDTYAALVGTLGIAVDEPPRYATRAVDPLPDVPEGHVALVPCSASGRVREWQGFAELARRLPLPVVFYGGPGEEARVAAVAGAHVQRVGLPLPAFARALSRASVAVGNDSGAAHFARAVGVPTVVIYGSTTPIRSGPAGAIAVEGPSWPCRPCYGRDCPVGEPCLDIPVEAVWRAVLGVARG